MAFRFPRTFPTSHLPNLILTHPSKCPPPPVPPVTSQQVPMASLASNVNVTLQQPAVLSRSSPPSLSASASLRRRNVLQVSLGSRAASMVPVRSRRPVMMATPTDLNAQLSQSIKDAEELCDADKGSGECAAAWDEVEEISAEIAHKRVKDSEKKDPLEAFCKDSPEADECRVYED